MLQSGEKVNKEDDDEDHDDDEREKERECTTVKERFDGVFRFASLSLPRANFESGWGIFMRKLLFNTW